MTSVVPVTASAPGISSPRVEVVAPFGAAAHRQRTPLCTRRHVDFGRLHSSACRAR
ncbi:hypothetical protein [Streptomyces sp. SID3343]|uniref:hypothetical protein n=1 Tax=Streptomyces sp. SID3343 TaxID=2690260 RepID=UPI00136995ED|nr:hypothetical protein [Streptomyces sp. SID3343]MYW06058.1 hypothetical protein [Streptomyces sp. SID3343]